MSGHRVVRDLIKVGILWVSPSSQEDGWKDGGGFMPDLPGKHPEDEPLKNGSTPGTGGPG